MHDVVNCNMGRNAVMNIEISGSVTMPVKSEVCYCVCLQRSVSH